MADTKNIVLTPEGRQKLVEELEYREGTKPVSYTHLVTERNRPRPVI